MEQTTETIGIKRPLFMVSEPPQQSKEVIDAIDAVHRDILNELGVPHDALEDMVVALRNSTTYLSYQDPHRTSFELAGDVLRWITPR